MEASSMTEKPRRVGVKEQDQRLLDTAALGDEPGYLSVNIPPAGRHDTHRMAGASPAATRLESQVRVRALAGSRHAAGQDGREPKEWEAHGSVLAIRGSVEAETMHGGAEGNEIRKLLWGAGPAEPLARPTMWTGHAVSHRGPLLVPSLQQPTRQLLI
jgi:hypothetical protein